MSVAGKSRLVWFDANRVFAAIGVVLIHSSTDFSGQPFVNVDASERLIPVVLRSLGEFSGSEMFFLFSLFLMAMRVDKKMPSYSSAIAMQAQRLLIPFVFWVVFYAFFRLLKADTFNYVPYIWDQITDIKSWFGYLLLGKVQYHMHFLPTLFALFLFYPLMRGATRYPMLGLTLFVTLGIMNNTQGFIWGLGLEAELRDYIIRAIKIMGYVGYGLAAFALYGLWKDGIPRGESRLLRRGGFYFAALAYVATIPFFAYAVQNGAWGVRSGWDFYGHFLMPICIFLIFLGGQYRDWSPSWSKYARYSFGVYLVHPAVIDLFDIALFKSGTSGMFSPTALVLLRFAVALPASLFVSLGISKISLLAWTIGLGPTPWNTRKTKGVGA
ncbi:acyltransferase [Pacificibacter marinus]|uniref:Acyltransferase family protein n=1 Tax=Pacificibacter marinus TaxID=658057 RepID=A0A1Y5T724_9RHOB|nr:acyltransferase [Pacificibacter marinus]SEL37767.1 Surface polysaccharide O-acyltransferase, integral membrane enzyme [Pacificibacter marinus]SLN55443.1 Acyltransferase family protein [Pacificibacter marinus]